MSSSVHRKAFKEPRNQGKYQLIKQLDSARRRLLAAQRDYKIALRDAERIGVAEKNEEKLAGTLELDVQLQDTRVHIFVGGLKDPNHGHWVVDASTGAIVYRRDPGEQHGWWNHCRPLPRSALAS